ncbi:MAG: S9 family peptidase [Actinomycetota bacterium]
MNAINSSHQTPDSTTTPGASPPQAPRRSHVWHRPTGDTPDHFAWMRDVDDPEFIQYLHAENAHADGWFAPHDDLVGTIFEEIRSRVQETDVSSPVFNGGWWYVGATEAGQSYARHLRGRTADTATDELILDENVEAARFAEDGGYFDLGAFDASHDHRDLAWSIDTTGDERYTLRIRRAVGDGTFVDLDDEIDGVSNAGTAWSADGTWLFYVRPDDQERPFQVWRHRLGAPVDDDVLVHEEPDERFFVSVGETRSDRWIVVQSDSKASTESRVLRSNDPTGSFTVIRPRRDGVEYHVDDWGDRFVMVTNDGAVDFRVLATEPATAPRPGAPARATELDDLDREWVELIAPSPGRRLVGADPFADFLVVSEWADAQPRLRLVFRDGTERIVEVSDAPHDVNLDANPEWTTDTIRYRTQSLVEPVSVWDESVSTAERMLVRRVPTPNVDLDHYVSSRVWAESPDGTSVPVDVVHHVDTPFDGTAACCLYGYGSYEASLPPWFSVARLSLLDRGVVWALAHPRGGGELGRSWYDDGKLLAKQHTFDDMLAVAEHLVAERICAPDRLAIRGGSAGGLLVGACMTQRPDRFASVVAEVPFVDIVSTMSDPSLPLTVTEWEEWGDPRAEPFASAMLAYSPYDNTTPQRYPAVYVTAGLTDPRVSVHEPAKWVARLREVGLGDEPIVFRCEMGAGHGGPTGRYDAWRDEARTLAFLLTTTA